MPRGRIVRALAWLRWTTNPIAPRTKGTRAATQAMIRSRRPEGRGPSGLAGVTMSLAPGHGGSMAGAVRSGDADPEVAADVGAKLAGGQGADVTATQGAVGADEHGGRQGGDPKLGSSLPLRVGGQRVGDAGLGGEPAGGVDHVAAVQPEEADLVLSLEVDLLEARHLLAAGTAPGSPHVKHQRPPAKVIRQVEPGPAREAGHLETDGVRGDPSRGRGSILAAGRLGAGCRAGSQQDRGAQHGRQSAYGSSVEGVHRNLESSRTWILYLVVAP